MKVLVTGASGYLGGRLCCALLNQGYSVKAFVRRTSDLSSLPPPNSSRSFELAYGDVTDYRSLLDACSGCQVIFHAAALVEPWLPDPSKLFSVNVGGLKNVLQAFKEAKTVEKIVYTSSFFALGSTDGYVADENQIHPGKFFCTEYEKSKAVADKIALEAAAEGLPIVIVYPGVVYGPGKVTAGNIVARLGNPYDCTEARLQIIERFNWRLPGYIGSGNDRYSFSHVDDVVDGHIAAMNKGRLGERYLLTGENASFKQVFDMAAAITKTKKPWFSIPLPLIDAYGWICVLVSRITRNLPLISPPAVDVLRHQWAYSCEKAKAHLDYNPRGLAEGLSEMALEKLDMVSVKRWEVKAENR
ncbi:NAD-dependent epimerase/dehydratase, partial [Dillenia turbinata]